MFIFALPKVLKKFELLRFGFFRTKHLCENSSVPETKFEILFHEHPRNFCQIKDLKVSGLVEHWLILLLMRE